MDVVAMPPALSKSAKRKARKRQAVARLGPHPPPDPEGDLRRRLGGRKARAYRKRLRDDPEGYAAEMRAELEAALGSDPEDLSEVSGDDTAASSTAAATTEAACPPAKAAASAVAEAACPPVVATAAVAKAAFPLAAAVAEAACPPVIAQAPAKASAQAAASSSSTVLGPDDPDL